MADVPVNDQAQVSPQVQPTVGLGEVSPNLFGAQVGRALEQGEDRAINIYKQEQEKQRSFQVMDAENQKNAWTESRLNDPQNGLLKQEAGKNAGDAAIQFQKDYEKNTDEILSKIPDPRAREVAKRRLAAHAIQTTHEVNTWETKQFDDDAVATYNIAGTNAVNGAVNDVVKTNGESLKTGELGLQRSREALAQIKGQKVADADYSIKANNMYIGAIDEAVSANNPELAKSLLSTYGDKIKTPGEKRRIEHAIQLSGIKNESAQQLPSLIYNDPEDPAKGLVPIEDFDLAVAKGKIDNPEKTPLWDAIETRGKIRYAEVSKADRQWQDTTTKDIMDQMEQNKTMTWHDVPADTFSKLSPENRQRIENYPKRLNKAEAPPLQNDNLKFISAINLRNSNPYEFSKIDPLAMMAKGEITGKNAKDLLDEQQKQEKGEESTNAFALSKAEHSQVDGIIASKGFNVHNFKTRQVLGKPTPEDAYLQSVYNYISQQKQSAMKVGKYNPEALKEITNEAVRNVSVSASWEDHGLFGLWNSDKEATDTFPSGAVHEYNVSRISDIPDGDAEILRDRIAKARKINVKDVTDTDIIDLHNRAATRMKLEELEKKPGRETRFSASILVDKKP